jgi:gamma-glutamylcyclotransferase (GGCT)/AIG2-like uncharacterized protein YtfP
LFSRLLFFIVSGLMVQAEYHMTAIVNQSMSGRRFVKQDQMTPESNRLLVAVYGTLKRGLVNHHLLSRAHFLGEDCMHAITLYDLGPYPGAKAEQSQGIDVEVYAITPAELEQLDELEDFRAEAPDQGEYTRVLFDTVYGAAWIYLYNPDVSHKPVQRRGSWQPDSLIGQSA